MNEFEIYFSDLNEDAQKQLMEQYHITNPSEANWDIDLIPLATLEIPFNENENTL